MESKIFENFAEASSFAKNLAHQGIVHNLKRNGASWLVEHEKSQVNIQPKAIDIQPLLRKIEAKDEEIESLGKANADLQSKLDTLTSSIHEQVAELTAKDKSSIEAEKQSLSEEVSRLRSSEAALKAQQHKLELLEKEYAECFGEAEVRVVKEKSTSKEVCPRCGGDGGVKGGCQKCDGIGWVDVTREHSTEVVEIK